jgi:hypothetical protein
MKGILRNQSGALLIDSLVSIALASLAVMGCLYLSGQSTTTYQNERIYSHAYMVLENLAESFIVSTNTDGTLNAGSHTQNYNENGSLNPNGIIKVQWMVNPGVPMATINQIQMSASWSTNRLSKTVSITVYKQVGLGPGSTMFTPMPVPMFAAWGAATPAPTPPPGPTPTPPPGPPTPTPTPSPNQQ